MADKNKINQKDTDRDFKPTRGQESNENWDDTNEQSGSDKKTGLDKGTTNSPNSGQEQLPDEKSLDRGNLTGPGLG